MTSQFSLLLTDFFVKSLQSAILPVLIAIACVAFFLWSFIPASRQTFGLDDKATLRKYLLLLITEMGTLLGIWYVDNYYSFIALKAYPFAFFLLVVVIIAGYRAGLFTYLITILLVAYYLIFPRYHYFPALYKSYLLDTSLELFVGFVIGSVIRRYQIRLLHRLLHAREELQFTALEKIAMQSEEKALLRAIDTSSEVVTSSELSLTSILSTSQYWLSNVLKIVSEETRHLLDGKYAGIGFFKDNDFEIAAIARDKTAKKERSGLVTLLLENILKDAVPSLTTVKSFDVADYPALLQQAKLFGFSRILVAPIISKRKVIGGLFLTNNRNEKSFNDFDKRRLQLFASYAGLSIVNMHHYEKLSGLVEGRDQLLSMVSHELKTPLSTIKLYAQLLQEQATHKKEQRDLYNGLVTIDQEVDKLTSLVNSIHDFSRIRSGIFAIDKKEFNVVSLCEHRLKIVQQLFPNHTFAFQKSVDTRMLFGDKLRIEQVVTNLLTNAAKYSQAGTTITLSAKRTGAQMTIAVRDQGVGIAPEDQAHIFEPFYQAQQSDSGKKGKGLGLGLYIAKEIIARHGGKIWVESEPAMGSTFALSLPIGRIVKNPARTKSKASQEVPATLPQRRLRDFALNRQR